MAEPTIWIAADVGPLNRLSLMNEMPLAANWSSVNVCVLPPSMRCTLNFGRSKMVTPAADRFQSALSTAEVAAAGIFWSNVVGNVYVWSFSCTDCLNPLTVPPPISLKCSFPSPSMTTSNPTVKVQMMSRSIQAAKVVDDARFGCGQTCSK